MCSGHIVFFLEQHVIKRYFFKQRSGEKTKKPKIAEDGEAYSGGKSRCPRPPPPTGPRCTATGACEGIGGAQRKALLS